MKKIYILALLLSGSYFVKAQTVQGSIGVSGEDEVTIYVKPSSDLVDINVDQLYISISIPDPSPGDIPTVNILSELVGNLDHTVQTPYVSNGRVYYDFPGFDNLNGTLTSWFASNDNAVLELEFVPPVPAMETTVELNDLTGLSGGDHGSSYFYVQISGPGDVTNYGALFYESPGSGPPNNNPGNNSSVETLASVLPIELISFTAKRSGENNAILNWVTASEINSSHFEVYRSSTNNSTWQYLGRVEAARNSSQIQRYEFLDANIHITSANTKTYYYRLRMVDLDDQFEYSNIESVSFGRTFDNNDIITIYPNPSSRGLHVQFPTQALEMPTVMTMYDNTGRIIFSRDLSEGTDYEYIDYTKTNITTGAYILQIGNADTVIDRQKVIVQRTQ